MKFKNSLIIFILSATILGLCSCGGDNTVNLPKKYVLPSEISSVKSGIIQENDRLSMGWDIEKNRIALTDKKTGACWSTVLYDDGVAGESSDAYRDDALTSSLRVIYIDDANNEKELTSASDATYITAAKITDGIMLTYCFDQVGISIPVIFRLENDGVSVELDVGNITELQNRVYKVSLLPFFASTKNDRKSYLFVPSGSGALMYTDDVERSPRSYSESVFGEDAVVQPVNIKEYTESIRLPIFGAKRENDAVLGIITSGAEIAEINATAGDPAYGYSAVYPTFCIRGKSTTYVSNGYGNTPVIKYTDGTVKISRPKVKYVFLERQNADYCGMAKEYRNYLIEQNGIRDGVSSPDVTLTVLGGILSRKLFLGVPYQSVVPFTKLSSVAGMLSDLAENGASSMAVLLKGFGSTGLDYGKIGGNFTVSTAFGGKKELAGLQTWCDTHSVDLGFDLETVYFNKASKEHAKRDAAKTAGGIVAKRYDFSLVTRNSDDYANALITSRYSLARSAKDLVSFAKKYDLNGIGLSSLGSVAFSDYGKSEYYCKAHMPDDVSRIVGTLKKSGIKVYGENENSYAAVLSDYIFDSPTESSGYYALDVDVPVYQMVFRGLSALSGGAINLAKNPETEFLNTVSFGCSPYFVVCESYHTEVLSSNHSALAAGVYSDVSDTVANDIQRIRPVLESVSGSSIVSYRRDGDVSTTVFDNGTTVCVNYGTVRNNSLIGMIEPRDFLFTKG